MRWIPTTWSWRFIAWVLPRIPRTPLGLWIRRTLEAERWAPVLYSEFGVVFVIGFFDRLNGCCLITLDCDPWHYWRWLDLALHARLRPNQTYFKPTSPEGDPG